MGGHELSKITMVFIFCLLVLFWAFDSKSSISNRKFYYNEMLNVHSPSKKTVSPKPRPAGGYFYRKR